MKTRIDFVSNSSSCSFIIDNDAAQAAKTFLRDFASCLVGGYETMGNSMSIGILTDADPEDAWASFSSPENFAERFTARHEDDDGTMHDAEDPSSITMLEFNCDDYDSGSVSNLVLLFKYFEKLGFKPNADDSEHEFLDLDSNSSFLAKLFSVLGLSSKPSEDAAKPAK